MAGWDRNANWNRDVLEHIAALLFALASLADLAADTHYFRRRRVLEILGHGEAEARAFVMGMVSGAPVVIEEQCCADDAARLAASFRALALLLCALSARRLALFGAARSRDGRWVRKIPGQARRRRDAPAAAPPPDTS